MDGSRERADRGRARSRLRVYHAGMWLLQCILFCRIVNPPRLLTITAFLGLGLNYVMVGRLSIPFFSFYKQDKNQQDFSSSFRFSLTSLTASSASGSASLASLVICSEGTVSFSLTSRWDQRVEHTPQELTHPSVLWRRKTLCVLVVFLGRIDFGWVF